MIVVDGPFEVLNGGKRLLAKAFDNRYGVFMALEMARYFANIELPFDLYGALPSKKKLDYAGLRRLVRLLILT